MERSSFLLCVFIILSMFISENSQASFLELNAMYLSDTMTAASTSAANKTLVDFGLGFGLDTKGKYNIGWNISSNSVKDTAAATTTFSTADQGIKFVTFFDSALAWGLGVTYNMIVKAKYNDGVTEEEWRGTSIKVELGYAPPIVEGIYAGLHLNYYAASFKEQILNTTTLNTISYSRPIIYPSIYFAFRYK